MVWSVMLCEHIFYFCQVPALCSAPPAQARSGSQKPLPFAIMTSGDTHSRTLDLLERNAYFGMDPNQV